MKSSPNPDIFEEIYPDLGRNQSNCNGENESESDSDSDSGQEQRPQVSDLQRRLREIEDELKMTREELDEIAYDLLPLREEDSAELSKWEIVQLRQEELRDQLIFKRLERVRSGLDKQRDSLQHQLVEERAKEQKAKEKLRQEHEQKKSLKRKRDQERQEAQDRVRRERENFWPRYCYSVCITVEYDSNTQPYSRGISEAEIMQVSSPTLTEADTVAPHSKCDLVLSYVTSSAGWTPIYDLQLSTANSTAILCFNAHLINTTSETWSNCKVVLSSAIQAVFGGLDNVTPRLKPWKIKLSPKGSSDKQNQLLADFKQSTHYIDWMASKKSNVVNKPRGEMFIKTDLYNDALGEFEGLLIGDISSKTSYDLMDIKTLVPKSSSSKHRVARLTFPNVKFSHVVVAKDRPGANLKTIIRNTSKTTLVKGPVGLTLDGRFLGHTALSHCRPGFAFRLNLGVDPAIKMIYCKPTIQKSTTWKSAKEDGSTYLFTRDLFMENTGALAGKPVPILVRDQIPVSEDDCLGVRVLYSAVQRISSQGPYSGGPELDALRGNDWDKEEATCKDNGEVNWHVTLSAGKGVRLSLQYSVSFPSEKDVVQYWDS